MSEQWPILIDPRVAFRYQDVEPTFEVRRRPTGSYEVVVTYGTYGPAPETFVDWRVCRTKWGARRLGRQVCERIRYERAIPTKASQLLAEIMERLEKK